MISTVLTALESALWGLLSVLWSALAWWLRPVPITIVAVVSVVLYRYITRNYEFWSSLGVRCVPSKFPWGHNLGRYLLSIDQILYDKYHGEEGYVGYMEMMRPVLHLGNPDLIRAIFIKDFEYFTDRRDLAISEDFKHMLSVMNGRKWKETRNTLSPTFSASKLKAMHQLCLDTGENLSSYMRRETEAQGKVDIKDAFGRFTMDNIASCAFGVKCNSFTDPNSEFAENAKFFLGNFKGYPLLRLIALTVFPDWLIYRTMPDPNRKSIDFFKRVTEMTIQHRAQNKTVRRDFLQLLLETKNEKGERVLGQDSIVMNSVLFFIAGYDTTGSLMTFCAYALATSPECQRLVHEEIDRVLERHNGEMTYEAVGEMSYLDRMMSETLRLYPFALRLERQCSKSYTLPGTTIQIPPGQLVQVPVVPIHRDPKYYPDPLKFDPDRFLPEAKASRHPCAYIPFGAGPRNCIAMRFALFEAKVALAAVLRDNRVEPTQDLPPPPMPLEKTAFVLKPKDTIFLKIVPRS